VTAMNKEWRASHAEADRFAVASAIDRKGDGPRHIVFVLSNVELTGPRRRGGLGPE